MIDRIIAPTASCRPHLRISYIFSQGLSRGDVVRTVIPGRGNDCSGTLELYRAASAYKSVGRRFALVVGFLSAALLFVRLEGETRGKEKRY